MVYKSKPKQILFTYIAVFVFSVIAYFWEGKNNFSVIIAVMLFTSIIFDFFSAKVTEVCLEAESIKIKIKKAFTTQNIEILYENLFVEYFRGGGKTPERISFFDDEFIAKLKSHDGWDGDDIKEIYTLLSSRAKSKELQ